MGSEDDARWQRAWAEANLSRAQRVPGRQKFFALNAYPGTSGFFHLGHLRGLVYGDALARFHRMRGEQVFVPFGVHASGLPAVTFAQRVADRNPAVLRQLEAHGVPEAEWARYAEPESAARELGASYARAIASVGVLVDPLAYVTTVDDDYRAFVRWQFRTLHALGALAQRAYYSAVCPVCGPVAVDPTETDLERGGDAEIIAYTTVPFALADGRFLLAATLRPETVYGVTNLWVAPGGSLTVWHSGEHAFLVSAQAAPRLVEQHGGRLGHTLPAAEVIGRTVAVPFTGRSVPVLESPLVDPSIGTGVVMSVPAHAPADAAALAGLAPEARAALPPPPVLLEVPAAAELAASEAELVAGPGTPAERALRAVGAGGLADRERVDAATERLYRLEFVRGRMTIPELSGVLVREARDRVAADLAALGTSVVLREFSKPVVCRNGHAVGIRRVPDQWFLRYGEPEWKAETRASLARLTTWPPEYRAELESILDWFEDRPCTRRGRWLGTPFPLDPTWTIEPIADSTFYMAYFVVRRYVANGRLKLPQLTDALFDYVFRGLGPGEPSVARPLLDELRAEFLYWYPLDLNAGGHEHKRVHFPVFLYTHARLLPPELRPRGVFVIGWILGPSGSKLSKKEAGTKGGAIPSIAGAVAQWGADPLRLFYATTALPSQDVEWDPALVETAGQRLGEVERLVREALGDGAGPPELDAWLLSTLRRGVAATVGAFEAQDLRGAAEWTYGRLPAVLRRYYTRGGRPGDATRRFARAWIRLLAPMTPHLAERLGVGLFEHLVAQERFPEPDEFPSNPAAEAREAYLERIEEDLRAVLRPQADRGGPAVEGVVFFLAPPWKAEVERWLRERLDRGEEPSVRAVMERLPSHPEIAAYRAEVPRYVQRVAPLLRAEPRDEGPGIDEAETLREAAGYLARRFGFPRVDVVREEEAAAHDPLGRRERARPGRPAFYLARPPPA